MRRLMMLGLGAAMVGGTALAANAQTFAISLGIRETNTAAPIGGDGGTANGIEWVNLDGQSLVLDGTWQTFTFNFQTDPLTAFAGTTANSMYDFTRGTIEHIRIRNSSGVTLPVQLFLDNIVNTTSTGAHIVQNWEGDAVGSEVSFQEPGFSGSTAANVLPGSTAAVTDTMAAEGTQSYELNFQFVDATNTRWVRLTTFPPLIDPNLTIEYAPGDMLTFQMKGVVIPEPGTAALFGLGSAGLLLMRRRRA